MKKTIYLLEDDPGIQELVVYLLQLEGYNVMAYGTVKAFNEQVKTALPDMFILDITLPDGNGLDVSRQLFVQDDSMNAPVLIMSANPGNADKLKESGASAFISKPFDINDLTTKVKKFLNV